MCFILTWATYTSYIVFELQMVPQIIFYKYKYLKSHWKMSLNGLQL